MLMIAICPLINVYVGFGKHYGTMVLPSITKKNKRLQMALAIVQINEYNPVFDSVLT